MNFTTHALERLRDRGISEADVELALRWPLVPPTPGNSPDTVRWRGMATEGRILRVVTDSADHRKVVTAMWEGG